MASKAIRYIGVVVLVLVLLAVAEMMLSAPPTKATSTTTAASGGSAPYGAYVVQLTDPPEVPNGTQSLVITYSGLRLHELGGPAAPNGGFVNVNSTGIVDLLGLANLTDTIGVTRIAPNSTFDFVTFNVTSARIEINDTFYNVTVPSGAVRVSIKGGLNSSNGGALVDLAPTVLDVYTANQTKFILVPSARAIAVGRAVINASGSRATMSRARLNASERAELDRTRANISIEGAMLVQSGNATSVSVTVHNNGNESVVLTHVMVRGYVMADFSNAVSGRQGTGNESHSISINTNGTGNVHGNASMEAHGPGMTTGGTGAGVYHDNNATMGGIGSGHVVAQQNITHNSSENPGMVGIYHDNLPYMRYHINTSVMGDMHDHNATAGVKEAIHEARAFEGHFHNVLNFLVSVNGTLRLPFTENEAEGPNGYTLAPGSTVTLNFTGSMRRGESGLLMRLVQNQSYTATVIGEDGARASLNTTAG